MKIIILPLVKSPYNRERIGPRMWQDWYRGCKRAVALQKGFEAQGNEVEILVLSNFQLPGDRHEAEIYSEVLRILNAHSVRELRHGYETTEQVETAAAIAQQEGKQLVIISSPDHFPRVWWIGRGNKIKHRFAFGIPRPKDFLISIILDVLFPIIDMAGQRERYKKYLKEWRMSGDH